MIETRLLPDCTGPSMQHERADGTNSQVDRRTDHELVLRFVKSRDADAFRTIVVRHAPMVMRVCRGMLRHEHDAEDACQATFLVLAKAARKIRRRDSLASWLYGTAYRVCLKASARIGRRKEESLGNESMIADPGLTEVADRHAQSVLHEELARLPEKYRAALVICYLEGMSREEAARQLGCSVGTVKGRLERGRQLLRRRLLTRGAAICVLVGTGAGGSVAHAAVAESLVTSTVGAALAFSQAKAAHVAVGSNVLELAQGELAVMSTSFTKYVAGGLAAAAFLFLCGLFLSEPASAERPVTQPSLVWATSDRPTSINAPPILLAAAAADDEVSIPDADGAMETIPSRARVEKLEWVGDGNFLVFGGAVDPQLSPGENATEMWMFELGRKVRLPTARGFACTPDAGTYATLDPVIDSEYKRFEIRLHNLKRREFERSFFADTTTRLFQAYDVAFSPDKRLLGACGYSFPEGVDGQGDVVLFDLEKKRQSRHIIVDDGGVYCFAFAPDGKTLVTGQLIRASRGKDTPGIKVWNVADGSLIHAWPSHREIVWQVAYSPDGTRVASVGHTFEGGFEWNKLVSVHNLQTGELEHNLEGHERSPQAVTFSPDGELLASGGVDKTVRIWDVESGELLATFTGHQGAVAALAFSPDGTQLASGDRKKAIHFWDISALGTQE